MTDFGLDFSSSGSLATMAQAMLDNTEFKSSHPDLTIWMSQEDDQQQPDSSSSNINAHNNITEQQQHTENITTTTMTSRDDRREGDLSSKQKLEERQSILSNRGNNSGSPTKRSERSVVIQVPPKRRKIDPSLTATRLAHEISVSANPGERMEVLQRAKEFLDHTLVSGHDDEIAEGLDVVLAKHLVFLVFKISRCRHTNPTVASSSVSAAAVPPQFVAQQQEENLPSLLDDVCSALEAMEMLYRASDGAVGDSFGKVGPDLLHCLVTLIDEELNRRVICDSKTPQSGVKLENNSHTFKPIKDEEGRTMETSVPATGDKKNSHEQTATAVNQEPFSETPQEDEMMGDVKDDDSTPELQRPITPLYIKMGSPEGNFLIQKATKVMGHYARVGKATGPMALFPGLLSCMLNLINYQPYDSIPWEARLSALWILGNLACNPENMQIMMCTPGLVRSLVRVGCRALHPDDPMEVTMEVLRSRSLSSRALLNLSWKPENKIPLSENFALVELLTQLAVHRKAPALNNSRTVRDILRQTRCHAVGALRNLAAAPRRTKILLCEYKNGHVLDALTDVALNDSDPSIQNRAFAAIHNLAIHDTAEKMVERPALVLALKDVLLEEYGGEGNSNVPIGKEGSSRSHASATLLVLERTITPDMDSYENLRDLLDAINPTMHSEDEDDPSDRVDAIEV